MTVDGRRRRYVPLDTLVAFSPFGAKLVEKWGMEGLCAWMLLLAAAKREPVQGTFTYTSEPEAWTKLGAVATSFTFEEFVAFCGRFKQTRKRRSGRVTYVSIPSWEGWNKGYKAQTDSERTHPGDVADALKTPSTDLQDTFKTPILRAIDAHETLVEGSQNPRSEALNSVRIERESSGVTADEVEVEVEEKRKDQCTDLFNSAKIQEQLGTDRYHALQKLLKLVKDADSGTPGVLASLCKQLPASEIEDVRAAYIAKGSLPAGKAVNALKDRVRDYETAMKRSAA